MIDVAFCCFFAVDFFEKSLPVVWCAAGATDKIPFPLRKPRF
jgi:hypothetical protein